MAVGSGQPQNARVSWQLAVGSRRTLASVGSGQLQDRLSQLAVGSGQPQNAGVSGQWAVAGSLEPVGSGQLQNAGVSWQLAVGSRRTLASVGSGQLQVARASWQWAVGSCRTLESVGSWQLAVGSGQGIGRNLRDRSRLIVAAVHRKPRCPVNPTDAASDRSRYLRGRDNSSSQSASPQFRRTSSNTSCTRPVR